MNLYFAHFVFLSNKLFDSYVLTNNTNKIVLPYIVHVTCLLEMVSAQRHSPGVGWIANDHSGIGWRRRSFDNHVSQQFRVTLSGAFAIAKCEVL